MENEYLLSFGWRYWNNLGHQEKDISRQTIKETFLDSSYVSYQFANETFSDFYSRFFLHSLINWLTRYRDLPFFPRILRELTFLRWDFEIFHLSRRYFAVFVFLQILACYSFFLTSDISDFWDIEIFQFSCRDLEIWIPWNTLPLLGAHIRRHHLPFFHDLYPPSIDRNTPLFSINFIDQNCNLVHTLRILVDVNIFFFIRQIFSVWVIHWKFAWWKKDI